MYAPSCPSYDLHWQVCSGAILHVRRAGRARRRRRGGTGARQLRGGFLGRQGPGGKLPAMQGPDLVSLGFLPQAQWRSIPRPFEVDPSSNRASNTPPRLVLPRVVRCTYWCVMKAEQPLINRREGGVLLCVRACHHRLDACVQLKQREGEAFVRTMKGKCKIAQHVLTACQQTSQKVQSTHPMSVLSQKAASQSAVLPRHGRKCQVSGQGVEIRCLLSGLFCVLTSPSLDSILACSFIFFCFDLSNDEGEIT